MKPEALAYLDAPFVSYPDRAATAKEQRVVLNVYVPANTPETLIDPGSAIVGLPVSDDWVLVYYEGDRFGIGHTYADKLLHAADRMVTGYPTVASGLRHPDYLIQVGTYDYATGTIDVTDSRSLTQWTQTS